MANSGNGAAKTQTPGTRRREPERAQLAFQEYVAMGPGRSLAKLCRHYTEVQPDNVPPLVTMKYWSRSYGWQARVREHDAHVTRAVQDKAAERQVEQRTDALGTVDGLIVEVARILEQHSSRETPLQLNTPQDFRAVASALTDLARAKELLEGRADSRRERLSPDELRAKLARVEAELAEYPGGVPKAPTRH